jgi:hypothetical protein
MKGQYEDRSRFMLPRRSYTIIRVDGKAFHSFTRHCEKPNDADLAQALDYAAAELCREAQGSCFAYVQSDEISVLLTDFALPTTEAWFDGNLQKIVSVSASVVTAAFAADYSDDERTAHFDARVFTIPTSSGGNRMRCGTAFKDSRRPISQRSKCTASIPARRKRCCSVRRGSTGTTRQRIGSAGVASSTPKGRAGASIRKSRRSRLTATTCAG